MSAVFDAENSADSHYFTDVREEMLADGLTQLGIAGILPGSRYHKQGAAVISALLEKGSISVNDYMDLTGREIGDKLLEAKNVFAFDFRSRQVTFQSTLMKRVCEETSEWKARK